MKEKLRSLIVLWVIIGVALVVSSCVTIAPEGGNKVGAGVDRTPTDQPKPAPKPGFQEDAEDTHTGGADTDTAQMNPGGIYPDGYQLVPVLCYTSSSESAGVTLRQFEKQMQFLKDNGYTVIPLAKSMEFISYTCQLPEKAVVITADGAIDWFEKTALSVLTTFDYPVTFFVDIDTTVKPPQLFWDRVRTIAGGRVSIQSGSGTVIEKEINQNSISLLRYFNDMKQVLISSKKAIETELGTPCVYYAFPSGNPNNLVVNLLRKNGYKGAFNLSGRSNPFFVDPYNINRIPIHATDSVKTFSSKLKTFEPMDLN